MVSGSSLVKFKTIPIHDAYPIYGDPILLVKDNICENYHQVTPNQKTGRECSDLAWENTLCLPGEGKFA